MSITDEIVLMKLGKIQQVATPSDMYRDPANQFVASFLGNPPIRFFSGEAESGAVRLAEGCTLRFRTDYTGPVTLGIRPEAWQLGKDVTAAVSGVEIRGREQFVSFPLLDGKGLAILDNDRVLAPGDTLGLTLSGRGTYLFHPETGVRLDEGGERHA